MLALSFVFHKFSRTIKSFGKQCREIDYLACCEIDCLACLEILVKHSHSFMKYYMSFYEIFEKFFTFVKNGREHLKFFSEHLIYMILELD